MKKCKKVLKWTAIAAGAVMAIVLITGLVLVWISGSWLERRIAAIRAAGDPVRLTDLARDPIPAEKNAAVALRRAQDDLEAIQKELGEVLASESYRAGRLDASQLKAVESALAACPKVIPLLKQAAACGDYNAQLDYTLSGQAFIGAFLSHMGDLRSAAWVLSLRARLLASKGRLDEALQDCILILQLSRRVEQPMLVGYLASLACRASGVTAAGRVLQSGPVSEDARDALEAELAIHDDVEAYRWALKTERVVGMELYREIPLRNTWFIRAHWDDDECIYLDIFDQHLALASSPHADVAESELAAGPTPGWRGQMAQLVKPAVWAAREAMERNRAQSRCLRLLNAVQRHVHQTGAAEPKLSELGLPEEATTDPFTGKPLHMKKLPEGWLIYSVGENLKDDGGKLAKYEDLGVGPLQQ